MGKPRSEERAMASKVYSEQHDGFSIQWDYDRHERVWTVAVVADDGVTVYSDYVPRKEFLKQAIADMAEYAHEYVQEWDDIKASVEESKAWNREHGLDENTIVLGCWDK
jgi:hypothetical protein